MENIEIKIITAQEGKVFRRISDQQVFGKELYLGYTYYEYGVLLDIPLLELPEHYEEIDEPIDLLSIENRDSIPE